MANKQVIRLTESELRKVIKESVKNVLKEAKPSDRTVGKHTLKGLRYDKNGNPLYTSDTMSDDEKKNQGWRFSKKHGLYGQLSDPTKLTESDLRKVIEETVKNVLKEGKYVNNKPFFTSPFGNIKPGQSITGSYLNGNDFLRQKGYETFHDAYSAVLRGELDKDTFDKWYDEHMKAADKHNDRLEYNWDEGNYDNYEDYTLNIPNYEDD